MTQRDRDGGDEPLAERPEDACLECDGAGQRWEQWGWGTYDFDAVDCTACGGTGRKAPAVSRRCVA